MPNDTPPYTPHPFARWTWVVWVFIGCYLVPIGLTAVYRGVIRQPVPDWLTLANSWLNIVGGFGMGIWFGWCFPLVLSYDPRQVKTYWTRPPRKSARQIQLAPFIVSLIPMIAAVVMLAAVVVEWGQPQWWTHLLGLAGGIVLIPVALVVSWRVRRTCRREFRRRVALLDLCYDCGYDLRAAESPCCPECGMTIESKPIGSPPLRGERLAADRPIG